MNMTIAAIYENGMLKPQQPLELAEGAQVQVTINSSATASSGAPASPWSEEGENRRRELIDKDIQGTITADELMELERLDQLSNEYFDSVAPPTMDTARQLHDRLLKQRAHGH